MKFHIQFYKTEDFTTDELHAMRRNQRGIWLDTGAFYAASTARGAIAQAKRDPQPALGVGRYKLRARNAMNLIESR